VRRLPAVKNTLQLQETTMAVPALTLTALIATVPSLDDPRALAHVAHDIRIDIQADLERRGAAYFANDGELRWLLAAQRIADFAVLED
jgi:hypothetical protein